jgi:hypothetical protein
MTRTIPVIVLLATCLWAQSASTTGTSFDDVVDRAIAQEQNEFKILYGEEPVAETYIQDLAPDRDFGTVPKTDHLFLGKVSLSKGISVDSFLPQSKAHGLNVFARLFSMEYLPRGFAQMMMIDGAGFDRAHYDFAFVRREFLGDVRTIVVDVSPKKGAGRGRFVGRIWVEDRDFNIVRFNGTYAHAGLGDFYMHFDSWRINCGPDLWLPYEIYAEEEAQSYAMGLRKLRFKALTHLWGYTTAEQRNEGEFTNVTVDLPSVRDSSAEAADNSPVESLRSWQRESEDNVLDRMEAANLIAARGDVEKVLDTVVNNLIVTNQLNIAPEVHVRVLLTTPLESFTVGHSIVMSRGLIDTLPDEASLAAVLAHELAHIALGHSIDTKFAFSDRVIFVDDEVMNKFRFARTQAEEDAANQKAVELLQKSPYSDKMAQAGLYLKALGAEADRLPNLIKPLFGSKLADHNNMLRMAGLLQQAPELQKTRVEQVAALPLGSRTVLDPWSDKLRMAKLRPVSLLSVREKLPFELTPVDLHLTYANKPAGENTAEVNVSAQ